MPYTRPAAGTTSNFSCKGEFSLAVALRPNPPLSTDRGYRDRYILQLRDGCGAEHCTTPTCFTCRKRIVGRAPIRRYNTTSARTLALHLASQDNPENDLCPTLRPSKAPPAALSSLIFVPALKSRPRDDRISPATSKSHAVHSRVGSPKMSNDSNAMRPGLARNRSATADGDRNEGAKPGNPINGADDQKKPKEPPFTVVEQPISKDHRSFAANVFGTVAFKMLEWLTPAAIEDMSRRTRSLRGEPEPEDKDVSHTELEPNPHNGSVSSQPKLAQESLVSLAEPSKDLTNGRALAGHGQTEKENRGPKDDLHHERLPAARTANHRRNSNAKVRTSSGPRPKRQLSIDPFTQDVPVDDPYSGLLISPRAPGGPTDKALRAPKTAGSSLSRPISQLSSAGFFDDVSLEKMPPPKTIELKSKAGRDQLDGPKRSELGSSNEPTTPSCLSSARSYSNGSAGATGLDSESEDETVLPQALSRLNAEVVDFVCDVMQEDGTAEEHMFEPPSVVRLHGRPAGKGKLVRRRRRHACGYSADAKLEWKLFVEQTLFYVLSNPQSALQSFTKKGQLYDSQTLWYCMLRMTRVAPSLVFHSLWMAAASLFAPPRPLQNLRSPTTKVFPKNESSLSNLEAGRLMSICLHALIAAAPLATDSRQLYDMSRIRSHGLSLAGSGAVARQPTELCLQYDDAFTNAFALRLARRLFAAIATRRSFDQLSESNSGGDENGEQDVLVPLFSQLDFLNMDAVYVLDFSFPDRALHETRVPILLLDWARAVMLNDWDGSPEVRGDGPVGGALALIESMCKSNPPLELRPVI